MASLYDLGKGIQEIRAAVDTVEVKGSQNCKLISFAYNRCNELIQLINDTVREKVASKPEVGKEGEENGELDQGTSG